MLTTAISSALVALSAIIIRRIFSKRINGRLLMIMWAVVFIKFALPFDIPSSLSVMNVFKQESSLNDMSSVYTPAGNSYIPSEEYSLSEKPAPEPTAPADYAASEIIIAESDHSDYIAFELADIARMIYIAVVSVLCTVTVTAYICCAVRFSRFKNADIDIQAKTDAAPPSKHIAVKIGDIPTPAVFGVFKSSIILPDSIDCSDTKTLRHILLHELTHIKHCDQLWNILTLLICTFNWYNPMVWICRVLFEHDTERYCDETVIMLIGEDKKKEYAQSLLSCAAQRSGMMFVSGFGESNIKSRIKTILSIKKVRITTAVIMLVLITTALVFLGTGRKDNTAEELSEEHIPAETSQTVPPDDAASNEELLWEHRISGMAGLEREPERIIQLFPSSDGRQELRFRLDGEYVSSLPVEGKITAPEESIIRPGNTGEYPGLIFVRLNTDINGTSMLYAYCVTVDNEFFRLMFVNPDDSKTLSIAAGRDFSYDLNNGYYLDKGFAPDYQRKSFTYSPDKREITVQNLIDPSQLPESGGYKMVKTIEYGSDNIRVYPQLASPYFSADALLTELRHILETANTVQSPEIPEDKTVTTFYSDNGSITLSLYPGGVIRYRYTNGAEDQTVFYALTDQQLSEYRSLISVTMDESYRIIAETFADELDKTDRSMSLLDNLVANEIYLEKDGEVFFSHQPSEWDIFRNVSVISNVKLSDGTEYNGDMVFRLTCNVQSDAPAPFKNGRNNLAVKVSEPYESGAYFVTKLTDYESYINHLELLQQKPVQTAYDYMRLVGVSENGITDHDMLFYLLYSAVPWEGTDLNAFDGLTARQLQEASVRVFGREVVIPSDSRYYDPAEDKYYALGMGIPPMEKCIFTDIRRIRSRKGRA